MKTSDEIKKGLEYLSITNIAEKVERAMRGLPYVYTEEVAADALALIQQLEAMAKPCEQIRWERDVAIDQLKQLGVGFGEKVDGKVPKWISVEDELPGLERNVLAINKKREWLVGKVMESPWCRGYECQSRSDAIYNVTHWMPLPEPLEEEQHGKA